MSINGLTPKQSELIAQWDAVYEGSAQALTWIEDVRHTAPSEIGRASCRERV